MSTTLTITVSEETLAALREQAAAVGKTPEALAADRVTTSTQPPPGYGSLRKIMGTLSFDIPDASMRVDELIGDGLVEELRGRTND